MAADDWNEKDYYEFIDLKSPPLGTDARKEIGTYIRRLQRRRQVPPGKIERATHIGGRCSKLYIEDDEKNCDWRVVLYIDEEIVAVLDLFKKEFQQTPQHIIDRCKERYNKALPDE